MAPKNPAEPKRKRRRKVRTRTGKNTNMSTSLSSPLRQSSEEATATILGKSKRDVKGKSAPISDEHILEDCMVRDISPPTLPALKREFSAKDGDGEGLDPQKQENKLKSKKRGSTIDSLQFQEIDNPATPALREQTFTTRLASVDPKKEFQALYLRFLTTELATTLSKLPDAQDFHPKFAPLLVHALRQGTAVFKQPEMERVAEAAKRAESTDV